MDISQVIDAGRWSAYQKSVLAITALAIVLDGFSNQALALAIPQLTRQWHVARDDFKWILVAGFIGMSVGTALFGMIGDRVGRRPTLIGCVLLFGVPTATIALIGGLPVLALLRFVAGLGLGGCLPNATALLAEVTPTRSRNIGVTSGILGIPIGGMIGGVVGAGLLPIYGWPVLFLVGGGMSIAVALVMTSMLPESPLFLARRPDRREDLARIMRRFGNPIDPHHRFVDSDAAPKAKGSVNLLFATVYRRDTVALWTAMFFSLFAAYGVLNWLPSILGEAGYSPTMTSASLTYFNIGGVPAALIGAACFNRFGSKASLLVMAGGSILATIWLGLIPLDPRGSSASFTLALILQGVFMNGMQTTMYALAAFVYPTDIRGAGVGWAVGVGRIGATVSPLVWAALLKAQGPAGFFFGIAGALAITFVGLALVRRHVPVAAREGGA
jgi:AAHS family 4-hydroxybenzoate transporter-like MFS transporter